MRKLIFTIIIVLLIFTYVIPEKNAQQIPHGPQIQQIVRTILKPLEGPMQQAIGTFVNSLASAARQQIMNMFNGQKLQLQQQVTNQINNEINNAIPANPSK